MNYVSYSDLNIELQFLSRSLSDSKFSISINDEFIDDIELQKITEGVYGNKGLLTFKNLHYKVGGNNPSKMQISYSGSNSSLAYLDYFTITGSSLFNENMLFISELSILVLVKLEQILITFLLKFSKL